MKRQHHYQYDLNQVKDFFNQRAARTNPLCFAVTDDENTVIQKITLAADNEQWQCEVTYHQSNKTENAN